MNDEKAQATETPDSAASALSAGLEPASRCPDFDGDCAGVVNHLQCWRGLKSERAGVVYFTGPADGYCPFVIGMKPKGSNDRVEGRDAASSRRVPSHDGLCGVVDTE